MKIRAMENLTLGHLGCFQSAFSSVLRSAGVSFLPVDRGLTTTVLLTVLCTGEEGEWADLWCLVLPACGEEPGHHSSTHYSLFRRGRRVSWPMQCPSYLWQGAWPPQFYSLFSVQEGKESELNYVVSFLPVARSRTTTVLLTDLCTGGEGEWADLCSVLPTCGEEPGHHSSTHCSLYRRGKESELIYAVSFLPVARSLASTVLLTILYTGGEGEWVDLCRVLPTCG